MIFTILGGGSAYAPGLIAALIHHRERIALTEVRLFDIDRARLDVVARLAAGMARGQFVVRAMESLDRAISGSDAILNSTRPGGLEARQKDEEVPVSLGIPGQETVGPGGFFFALRSVPAALEVADMIERLAPKAWLLNYTNPTNIVTQALVTHGGVRVLGLCDQSDGDLHVLGEAVSGKAPSRISFLSTGTNHGTWYSSIAFDDQPFPAVPSEFHSVEHHDEEHAIRFSRSIELAREVAGSGLWPNSYLPYYTHPADFVALSQRIGSRAAVILEKLPTYYRHFEEEAAKDEPALRHHRGGSNFGDMAVEVLAALTRPAGQRLVLNIPNLGAAPGYDPDTVVETVISLTPKGVVRLPGPVIPSAFASLHTRMERYQREAAIAAAGTDRSRWIAALALNPLVGSEEVAAKLIDARLGE